MSTNKTTQVRIYPDDAKIIKLLALKLSSEVFRAVNTAEVLHYVIKEIDPSGKGDIEAACERLKLLIENPS